MDLLNDPYVAAHRGGCPDKHHGDDLCGTISTEMPPTMMVLTELDRGMSETAPV